MNFLKIAQILLISFGLVVFFSACGESTGTKTQDTSTEETHEQEEAHDHDHADGDDHAAHASHGEGNAYTSAYVCTMHCEGSGSDAPGKCPVCSMDYIAQADHVADGHTHEE